jgi:two-component system OmpR family response regulator
MPATNPGGYAERVLLLHPSARLDDVVPRSLRGQRLSVTLMPLSVGATWPSEEYDAGLVFTDVLDNTVRSAAYRLKRERPRVPLLLWAPGEPTLLTDALDGGFDLWLPYQTPVAAVAAQVRAVCRLLKPDRATPQLESLMVRNVTIDFQRFEVRSDGGTLTLTPTEFKIIAHLAKHPGRVVRHTELFREVHGYDASEQEAKDILKVHIWRLRNKLAAAGADGDCIANVRGFGYLLDRRGVGDLRERRSEARSALG